MFIEIVKAIIYGIVEGITEWLPISSTGHLILLEEVLKFNLSAEFITMFRVVIQLGAILAVVVLFWRKIWPFGYAKGEKPSIIVKKDIFSMWFKVLVACVPAAIVGIAFDEYLDALYTPIVVGIMLILVGILFIIIENYNKNRLPSVTSIGGITYKAALIIGVAQLVAAILPGTSRSGATIIAALLIGVSREVAAEFTFYLAIPVMFGASLLKVLGFGFSFTSLELVILLVGTATAFIVSIFAIKFLMSYIKTNNFKAFGWYRIALGLIVLLYFLVIQ